MTIKVVQVTDLHITSPAKFYPEIGRDSLQTLQQVINELNHHSFDAVLCTGDITDSPTEAAYHSAYEQLKTLSAPVYCLPGNHDAPKTGIRIAEEHGIQWPRSIELGNWQIIFLSTHLEGAVHGHLGSEELATLDSLLQQTKADHILITLHHHPVKMQSQWMDELMLKDHEALFSTIDKHPNVRGLVWGHVHQEFDGWHNDVRMLATPSTCRQFKPLADDYTVDDKPPAFRILGLTPNGTIETETIYCQP